MAGAANTPLKKWDHKLQDTPKIACNVVGSGRCHCFGDNFITLYKRYVPLRDYQCAKSGCTKEATTGAHLGFGRDVVILPLCSDCNKPGASDCFKIARSRYPKALKLHCCCFNIGQKCHCDKCTGEGCNTCRCRTTKNGGCTCPRPRRR